MLEDWREAFWTYYQDRIEININGGNQSWCRPRGWLTFLMLERFLWWDQLEASSLPLWSVQPRLAIQCLVIFADTRLGVHGRQNNIIIYYLSKLPVASTIHWLGENESHDCLPATSWWSMVKKTSIKGKELWRFDCRFTACYTLPILFTQVTIHSGLLPITEQDIVYFYRALHKKSSHHFCTQHCLSPKIAIWWGRDILSMIKSLFLVIRPLCAKIMQDPVASFFRVRGCAHPLECGTFLGDMVTWLWTCGRNATVLHQSWVNSSLSQTDLEI